MKLPLNTANTGGWQIITKFKGGTEMRTYFSDRKSAQDLLNELHERKYRQYDAIYILEEST